MRKPTSSAPALCAPHLGKIRGERSLGADAGLGRRRGSIHKARRGPQRCQRHHLPGGSRDSTKAS